MLEALWFSLPPGSLILLLLTLILLTRTAHIRLTLLYLSKSCLSLILAILPFNPYLLSLGLALLPISLPLTDLISEPTSSLI